MRAFYINNNNGVWFMKIETIRCGFVMNGMLSAPCDGWHEIEGSKNKLPVFMRDNIPQQGYDKIFRNNNGENWALKLNRIYKIDKQTKQPVRQYVFSALGPIIYSKRSYRLKREITGCNLGQGIVSSFSPTGQYSSGYKPSRRIYRK